MLYCPECGAELEPGDEFCINCGASLVEGADNAPIAKKPKKKFNPIPLIIILSVIFLLAIAAIIVFSTPQAKLLAAITQTSYDLKENPTFAKLDKLAYGGSIEAEANMTEFLTDLQYLDDVDSKANAKIYFDSENPRLVINAGASVSGLSALDADLWIDGESATVKSGAFLGKDAYAIDLKPFYANPDTAKASAAYAKAIAYTKDTAILKLYHEAVKYGSLSQDKYDDETVYHLSIDAKAAESILRDFYAWAGKDSSSKRFFDDVDPSGVYAFIDSINQSFGLKLRFFTRKNNQITKLEVKTNDSFVSVKVDDPEKISLLDMKIQADDCNLECDSKISDSEDGFTAKVSCLSDGRECARMNIGWDMNAGDFEIDYDNKKITPDMKLFINEEDNAPELPGEAEEISLYNEAGINKISGAVSENVTALVEKLGLFLPFDLKDMIGGTLSMVAENYKGYIGSGNKSLSIKEITQIAQMAAEEKAAQKAQEIAEATAREISEAKAQELEALIDAKIAEIEKANKALSPTSAYVPADNTTDGSDTEKKDEKKDYKATIPGTYELNSSGISGTVALGADGTYAMKVQYLFYVLTDSGTYTVDDSGNVSFNTKLGYNVSGKYDGANSLQITIDGLGSETLKRK